MTASRLLAVGTILAACATASGQPQVLFYDSFEPPDNMSHWSPWQDAGWVPGTAGCNEPSNCWGPKPLFNSDSHAHDGTQAARQEQAQPWWYGSYHEELALADQTDEIIRVSAWQFEDANRLAPQHTSHDQVQGWLALMNEEETEFFAIGVHAHWDSPAPVLDWWGHVSWGTSADGWHTTTVPRAQGWRHLKIVLKPYTGSVGDVEFYVDDLLVGGGSRQPGADCRGVPVTRIGIGSSPAHVDEDYISNTYEFFWYDEVELSVEPAGLPCPNPELRFDADADGDVDQADFAVFQACYTETGSTYDCPACKCMNSNEDVAIDGDDYGPFEACASGPDVPADVTCDDGLPLP